MAGRGERRDCRTELAVSVEVKSKSVSDCDCEPENEKDGRLALLVFFGEEVQEACLTLFVVAVLPSLPVSQSSRALPTCDL